MSDPILLSAAHFTSESPSGSEFADNAALGFLVLGLPIAIVALLVWWVANRD